MQLRDTAVFEGKRIDLPESTAVGKFHALELLAFAERFSLDFCDAGRNYYAPDVAVLKPVLLDLVWPLWDFYLGQPTQFVEVSVADYRMSVQNNNITVRALFNVVDLIPLCPHYPKVAAMPKRTFPDFLQGRREL